MPAYYAMNNGIVVTLQVCLQQLPKECLKNALKGCYSSIYCDNAANSAQAWGFFPQSSKNLSKVS